MNHQTIDFQETPCTNESEIETILKKWVEEFTVLSYKEFLSLKLNQYVWERLKNTNQTLEYPESVDVYQKESNVEFYIIRKNKNGFLLSVGSSKNFPLFLYQEVIVFPKNMAWTMIFTHEDTNREVRSPFFIKSSKYEDLNKKNKEK